MLVSESLSDSRRQVSGRLRSDVGKGESLPTRVRPWILCKTLAPQNHFLAPILSFINSINVENLPWVNAVNAMVGKRAAAPGELKNPNCGDGFALKLIIQQISGLSLQERFSELLK